MKGFHHQSMNKNDISLLHAIFEYHIKIDSKSFLKAPARHMTNTQVSRDWYDYLYSQLAMKNLSNAYKEKTDYKSLWLHPGL